MNPPLHSKKRFLITLFFIALFFMIIPLVILYSTGYRLDKGFSLTPTGGMYVFYPESGAEVYLNGVLSDQTSLFERGIFINELDPEVFSVEVRKTGYLPWKKTITVEERRVAEAYPFLVPETVSTSSIQRFVTLASGTSVTNALYEDVVDLFTATTSKVVATSSVKTATSTQIVIRKDIALSITGANKEKQLVASWKGTKDATPFYFCDSQRLMCKASLTVAQGDIRDVDFYPGRTDVVIYTTADGLYAAELDLRADQNVRKLLPGTLQFKEDDQRVFVKEKGAYYELLFTASSTLTHAPTI